MPDQIEGIGRAAIEYFTLKHNAREQALPKSRATIRSCANAIRAAHRSEFAKARELIAQAAQLIKEMEQDLQDHRDIYYAGFVQDAQKEYVEAVTFTALIQNQPLPTATDLAVGYAAYLNGLAEAVGELRRYLLDQLRRGNVQYSETFLQAMDDIYSLLTTIDFPDAITGGLRRTTDATRGILEKTRGDLTSAVVQHQLQTTMRQLQADLQQRI